MELVAYVINLDRRPDRFSDFLRNFKDTNFLVTRVSALDGRSFSVSPDLPLSSNEQACWLSHLKVIDMFIESEAEHCLVFEDDAVPSTRSIPELEKTISQVIAAMKQHSISFVQLGHIAHLYRVLSRQGLGYRIARLGLWIRNKKIKVNYPFRLVGGEFRAGSHAMLLSRKAALALKGTNNPPMFSADGYYMALAQKSIIGSSNALRLATLVPPLFDQVSRSRGHILDSDIANLG